MRKKLYSKVIALLLATLILLGAVPAMSISAVESSDVSDSARLITLLFRKPVEWSGAFIYVMDADYNPYEGFENYPGNEMSFYDMDVYGYEIYTYKVPADTAYIKFTDGTYVDEENTNTNYRTCTFESRFSELYQYPMFSSYKHDSSDRYWSVICEDLWLPTGMITVTFEKPDDWNDAYVYIMNDDEEVFDKGYEYPGKGMTKVKDNLYSADIPCITGAIQFSDGSVYDTGENKRTVHIVGNDNIYTSKYFSIGEYLGDNMWDVVLKTVATDTHDAAYYLKGKTFGGWSLGTALSDMGDGTFSTTVELEAGEYEFRIFDTEDEMWLKTKSDVNNETDGLCTIVETYYDNAKLIALGGTYTFTVTKVTNDCTRECEIKLSIENIVGVPTEPTEPTVPIEDTTQTATPDEENPTTEPTDSTESTDPTEESTQPATPDEENSATESTDQTESAESTEPTQPADKPIEIPTEKPSEEPTKPQVTLLVGDANSDGIVNVKDATQIQKYLVNLIVFDDVQKRAADVNRNQVVNVKDATLIQKFIAGLVVNIPIGEEKTD